MSGGPWGRLVRTHGRPVGLNAAANAARGEVPRPLAAPVHDCSIARLRASPEAPIDDHDRQRPRLRAPQLTVSGALFVSERGHWV